VQRPGRLGRLHGDRAVVSWYRGQRQVAGDGAAGVEAVVRGRPDVVLMDLRMPGTDGITATEQITKLASPPAVVVLTTFDADQYVLRALRPAPPGSWSNPRRRRT
jgi:DNA-binding NarL/FixJ family response regulator